MYRSNPETYFAYTNQSETKINNQEKEMLDKPLSFSEFSAALKDMQLDSAPGSDGLTVAFYKMFWKSIGAVLFDAIMYAVEVSGQLHFSGRTGILALIPKANKNPEFLTNWRPITLMNVCHKIYAKVLANRIKPCLQKIISETQTGYMQGRFIGLNLRKLMDLLYMVEKEDMEAMLISVDFYKAFDSIEFSAVEGALKFFNFGERFVKMIIILYKNFQTKIMHNGYFSPYITPTRGVHQGCAVSGYLFIIAIEILAMQLKSNSKIRGIPIPQSEEKETVSQFVDNLTICSLFDSNSLNTIVDELEKLYLNTGLKVIFKKPQYIELRS